jgi:hypothetical protein
MNIKSILALLSLFSIGILMVIALFDCLKKRVFPSKNLQQLYSFLIVFPPALGLILYYILVVRNNRYPKKTVEIIKICPKCNSKDIIHTKIGRETLGLIILFIGLLSLFILVRYPLITPISFLLVLYGIYHLLISKIKYKCNNCQNKWFQRA